MEAILFYHEDDTMIANQLRMIDNWCAMAGMFHIRVDRTREMKRTNGNVFLTIQDALVAFPDHEWVFLSEKSEKTLGQYTHPSENVIYCVGSDTDGFQGFDLSGHKSFRLCTTHKQDNEWYAASIVPIVIADRMLRYEPAHS